MMTLALNNPLRLIYFLLWYAIKQYKKARKSPQISRILLSILADLNNEVVWMITIFLHISNFSNPFSKFLVTVYMCRLQMVPPLPSCSTNFLALWLSLAACLSFRFFWFSLYGHLGRRNPLYGKFSFLLIITKSCLLAGVWYSVSQNPREFYACYSQGQILVCA